LKSHQIKKTLLIIDDDRLQCDALSSYLKDDRVNVLIANTGSEGLNICSKKMVDIVLLDQKLPDAKGEDLCRRILENNDHAKIIFITAYPTLKNAISGIKSGAYDYLIKPFEMAALDLAVRRALATLDLEKRELVQAYKNKKEKEETVLIGKNGGLAEIWRLAETASSFDTPVLITGETGVGKNVVAKLIHYLSPSGENAYISINSAAMPDNMVEAELFGYEKGAFTGAVSMRKGLFEMAEGGTLFLDEIGTLPLHLQSKLLGVLDEKKLRRLGGESIMPVDVRVIAATNIEIEKAVKEGAFREDLYYRINVLRIHIPPLRERSRDIPDLCGYFLSRLVKDSGLTISDSEVKKLMDYQWPGNVRELRNIIERSIILRRGSEIFPSQLLSSDIQALSSPLTVCHNHKDILPLKELEKKHIICTLESLSGNHTRTANALGISRSTLKRKIKDYGIN
jgi:DNA-binding NtrC family response regulator